MASGKAGPEGCVEVGLGSSSTTAQGSPVHLTLPEELETAPTGTVEPTTEYSEISKQFFPARNLKLTTVELFN